MSFLKKILLLASLSATSAFGQHYYSTTGELWLNSGVKYKFNKQLDLALDLNGRFGDYKLQTFFPEFIVKYEFFEWFKPSVEYRIVLDREKEEYYSFGNRINLNFNFQKEFGRSEVSFRVRYQSAFSRVGTGTDYSPDFDNALRFKPEFKYDPKGFKLTPEAAVEFFYNPNNGPLGNRFTRTRFVLGFSYNLPGPQELAVKYFLDHHVNVPFPNNRHVLSIGYTYEFERKSDEDVLKEELEELRKKRRN